MHISLPLYFSILAIITMLTVILISNNNISKNYKMFMLITNIILYVISAAAFIYLWFCIYPEAHVQARTTGEPAILVYHRPRVIVEDHLAFIGDLTTESPEWDTLNEFTQVFDQLFDYLLAACGYTDQNENLYEYNQCELKHQLSHVRNGYYSNQDFVLPT